MTHVSRICLILTVFSVFSTAASARTWTDSTGQHTFEAEFAGMTADGKIQLRSEDGSLSEISPEHLSAADRTFLQSMPKGRKTVDGSKGIVVVERRSKKYAFLVGVNDYEDFSDLLYCEADVTALRDRLAGIGFDRRDIVLLSSGASGVRDRPSRRNIAERLDATLAQAEPGDILFVAFSGHGVKLDGQSWFCPLDARESDPAGTMISIDGLYKRLGKSRARLKIFLVDACRNNLVTVEARTRSAIDEAKAVDGFAQSLVGGELPAGIVLLTSCAPGERSWEDGTMGHGIFMNFILQGLAGRADEAAGIGNRDGWVSLYELGDYVKAETKSHVFRKFKKSQIPRFHASLNLPDFALTRVTGSRLVPPAVPAEPAVDILVPPVDPNEVVGSLSPDFSTRPIRDEFDTDAVWAQRVKQWSDMDSPSGRVKIATATLNKPYYDQRTGRFPLIMEFEKGVVHWRKRGEYVTLPIVDARTVYAQSTSGDITAEVRPGGKGEIVLVSPRLEIAGRILPLQHMEPFTNTIGMKFNPIPAGEFKRDSPASEKDRSSSETQHRVRITKAFYMGIHEVTQGQWKAIMGTEPWSGKTYVKEGPNYAATYVSWEDAVEFCKKLSAREGRTYRLPTEAEWEYACRAGTSTAYSFGNSSSILGTYAWYGGFIGDGNCQDEKYAHEVGQKRPNAWGLYDMHGNVWEWCQDWYASDYYEASPGSDPSGPSSGSFRVYRGGCWDSDPRRCRSALRFMNSPGSRYSYLGFRFSCHPAE